MYWVVVNHSAPSNGLEMVLEIVLEFENLMLQMSEGFG